MKSFSLKGGPSSKGFFGPNAQTLGSPFPATTPAAQSFTRVDGGIFPGDPTQDVAIASASNAAVITSAGNGAFSTNGGATWTHIGPLAGILTAGFNIVANTAGTVLCCAGIAGAVRKVLTSSNGGASWTDVTPVGSDIAITPLVFYSPTANQFFFFDGTAALVWHSANGTAWASNAIPTQLNPSGGFKAQSGYAADNGTVIVVSGIVQPLAIHVYSSTDAITWTSQLNVTGALIQGQNQCWSGSRFAVGVTIGGTSEVYTSASGTTGWALTSNSPVNTTPPYQAGIVAYNNAFYTAFNGADGLSIATSPNAVAWSDIVVPPTNATFGQALYPGPGELYLFGDGIDQSASGTSFTTALTLPSSGLAQMDARNGHVLAVGSDSGGNGGIWRAG